MAINHGPAYTIQYTSGSLGAPLALKFDEYTYKLAMALLVHHEQPPCVDFGSKSATFAGRMLKPADDIKYPFHVLIGLKTNDCFAATTLIMIHFLIIRRS